MLDRRRLVSSVTTNFPAAIISHRNEHNSLSATPLSVIVAMDGSVVIITPKKLFAGESFGSLNPKSNTLMT